MNEKELFQRINRLANLPENAGKSKKELRELALEEYKEQQEQFDKTNYHIEENQGSDPTEEEKNILGSLAGVFKLSEDRKAAIKLFNGYISSLDVDNESDKQDLLKLVFMEINVLRIQRIIEKETRERTAYVKGKGRGDKTAVLSIDTVHQKALNDAIQQVTRLKDDLGISRKKREELNKEKEEVVGLWQDLQDRAEEYIKKHPEKIAAWRCSNCGQVMLGNIPHWLFDEKGLLWNQRIRDLVEEKVLTPDEAASILGVNKDGYIEICKERKQPIKEDEYKDKD